MKEKQHKEDLFTTQFLHLWYKIRHLLAAFVQRLRKTQETVNSFTKTIAFAHLKILAFFSAFVKVRFVPFFFTFLFCSETSKAGKAKNVFEGKKAAIKTQKIQM